MTHEYSEEKENKLILDYENKKGDSKKKKPPLTSPATKVNGGYGLIKPEMFYTTGEFVVVNRKESARVSKCFLSKDAMAFDVFVKGRTQRNYAVL